MLRWLGKDVAAAMVGSGGGVTASSNPGSLPDAAASRRRWLFVPLGLAVLHAALSLPDHPDALSPAVLATLPVELPVVATLLLGAGLMKATATPLRIAVTGFILVSLVVKLADIGLFAAFGRPFNFAYDLPLVPAGLNVLYGSSGLLKTGAYVVGAGAAFALAALAVWWATGAVATRRGGIAATFSALAIAALAAAGANGGIPTSNLTTRSLASHVESAAQARAEIAALAREAGEDTYAYLPAGSLLQRLRGRDVIFAFVESYGRSSIDNPTYAPTTVAALSEIGAKLEAGDLVARSAWLTSPTVGGQSWLAHSTLLSGLWVDSQGRYGALMSSRRKTLLRLAAENGWRSVGVMPAITQPWPEAGFYGYTEVLAAKDLGYKGLPFNWVTMPDQYTWSAFERMELAPPERAPVFAEVALISSHAPWTPIPWLVPWEAVGDGGIFDMQASAGDTPEKVWSDHDRVRDQFRQAVDYALRTIGEFALRRADTAPLIVVLGDHQPAPFVSGTDANRDVPVHIIGDAATIAALDGWRWADGMVPDAVSPVWRMDMFRDRFLSAFSGPPDRETGNAPLVREPSS